MAIKWGGFHRIFPLKKGAIAENREIRIERLMKKKGIPKDTKISKVDYGKIVSVKETKTRLYITAKFSNRKKKKVSKKKLLRMILKDIDFKKGNLEKLFTKMMYLNFEEKDLKRILKHGGKFQVPKSFRLRGIGEGIFLKVNGKYYHI